MRKNILILGCVVLAATACGGGAEQSKDQNLTPQEKISVLEKEGKIPALERSGSILGQDSNNNGVRDDVDAYIEAKFPQADEKKSALQYAASMQKSLVVDVTNNVAVKDVKRDISRAIHCVYRKFNTATATATATAPARVVTDIQSITTNTKQRLLAYLAFNKALDGASWAMPEGDSCE